MNTPDLPPAPLSAADVPQPVLGSRALFPALGYRTFLAHAAISPLNEAGRRAAECCMKSVGAFGNGAFAVWAAQRERLRTGLANLLTVPPCRVGLSAGCTHSITDVALSLPWRTGDRLVSFQGEFPANIVPYQQAAQLRGGQVELLPLPASNDATAAERILESVEIAFRGQSQKVAYLAVSAVQFQTGLTMPLRELGVLCEAYDVRLLVDGIQACGVLPLALDDLRVDAFFSGAHKWMLGLEGAGFCAVSERLATQLQPRTAGWLSSEHAADFLFKGADLLRYDRPLLPAPLVFEGSTSNAVGLAALEAGVDIVTCLGPANIFDHVQGLLDHLEPRLQERGFCSLRSPSLGLRSCILSLVPPSTLGLFDLFVQLDAKGIRVSIPDGVLRIAPHFSNTLADMDMLIEAVDEVINCK